MGTKSRVLYNRDRDYFASSALTGSVPNTAPLVPLDTAGIPEGGTAQPTASRSWRRAAGRLGGGGGGGGAVPGAMVSLASATVEQLDQLPGIGPVTAQKIVDWRTTHGPFRSVDALDDVPGIGPARIEQLRDLVTP